MSTLHTSTSLMAVSKHEHQTTNNCAPCQGSHLESPTTGFDAVSSCNRPSRWLYFADQDRHWFPILNLAIGIFTALDAFMRVAGTV
ncbi:hypothetical protein QC762_0007240 [Podospora pseudocomata]|uniref:Uncharacterized protein n=1 Tax=Podospora pseudocomata TaxID=2093779 RepID=A0ABR0GU90_9PEZI|nr:hypothetical protein QC762_0007240 [Podospora pseudocomata]